MARPSGQNKLKPKRHHGYSVVLFILGTLFPPLGPSFPLAFISALEVDSFFPTAVAARFGIGSDFWLNLLLTICGYFPGHGHNFYIQASSITQSRPKSHIRCRI